MCRTYCKTALAAGRYSSGKETEKGCFPGRCGADNTDFHKLHLMLFILSSKQRDVNICKKKRLAGEFSGVLKKVQRVEAVQPADYIMFPAAAVAGTRLENRVSKFGTAVAAV